MKILQPGFSLIEVLISLVMVSITITSLLTLMGSLQKILFKDNSQWHAEQLAVQAFVDADKQQFVEPGKTIEREQDDFKMVYSVSKPQEGSPLSEIENLVIEKVVVTWTKVIAIQTFTLIRYAYRPKKGKDKAAMDGAQRTDLTSLTTSGVETSAQGGDANSPAQKATPPVKSAATPGAKT